MSDYGTTINIRRNDGNTIDGEEKARIGRVIESVSASGEYFDALGENFQFELSEIANDHSSLIITLSEYWVSDDDEAESDMEFAKETDLPQAEGIANQLKTLLGGDYTVIATFDAW